MDFLEKLLEKHGARAPRRHDEGDWHSARPHRGTAHDDPWHAHGSDHEHEGYRAYDRRLPGGVGRHGLLGVLSQHKALAVVAALLVLLVLCGGIVAVTLALVLFGAFGTFASLPDLMALLGDLPGLLSTLLVDVPKAILDYLAPLLQLKGALEGKG